MLLTVRMPSARRPKSSIVPQASEHSATQPLAMRVSGTQFRKRTQVTTVLRLTGFDAAGATKFDQAESTAARVQFTHELSCVTEFGNYRRLYANRWVSRAARPVGLSCVRKDKAPAHVPLAANISAPLACAAAGAVRALRARGRSCRSVRWCRCPRRSVHVVCARDPSTTTCWWDCG